MKRILILSIVAVAFSSCAGDEETKPVGPVSETSRIPWNDPGLSPGQGGGQFGMMPQNQYRR